MVIRTSTLSLSGVTRAALATLCAVLVSLSAPIDVEAQSSWQQFMEKQKKRIEELKDAVTDQGKPGGSGTPGATAPRDGQAAPAQPAGPGTKPSPASAGAGRLPTAHPSLGSTSLSMLVYRFAPELFSEEELVRRAAQQIKWDQAHHGTKSPGAVHHRPLFARDEVAGRNPEFAAREMIDVYRERVAALAAKLPTRYSGVIAVDGAVYDHTRGVLHKPRLIFPKPKDADHLVKEPILPRVAGTDDRALYALRMVSSLGTASHKLQQGFGYRVHADAIDTASPISMAANVPLPRRTGQGGGAMLALDRMPDVPPLPLPRGDVERMLTPPNKPGPEWNQYLGTFLFFLDLEVEDVVTSDRHYVIRAKLLGGTLVGTRGEVLKTYAAADFPTVASSRAGEGAEEARKAALAAQQAAEQQRTRNVALARMDVLGVRVGMPVQEAERALRTTVKVNTVYRFSASPPPRNATMAAARPFQPYDRGLLFLANDAKDAIALFHRDDGTVIAVTRRMRVDGATIEALAAGLTEKYGTPTRGERSAWIWGDTGKGAACAGQGAIDSQSAMELVEGQPVKQTSHVDRVTYRAVGVGVRHGTKAEVLANCHTVLQVHANERAGGSYVDLRLFDHSTVAGALKTIEDGKKARATDAGGRLKF